MEVTDLGGGLAVGIADTDKLYSALGGELPIVSGMVAPQTSYAYRGYPELTFLGHNLIASRFSAILYILI